MTIMMNWLAGIFCLLDWALFNTLRLKPNGHHFSDNIFKCIFLNKHAWILRKISLKVVPKVWINNIPALVQIMAWHLPGDKTLSEPMMVSLLMHICLTWTQWVNVLSTFGKKYDFYYSQLFISHVPFPQNHPKYTFQNLPINWNKCCKSEFTLWYGLYQNTIYTFLLGLYHRFLWIHVS